MRRLDRFIPTLAVGLLLSAPCSLTAQHRTAPATPAYALQNISVLGADGSRQDSLTLVVRGAFIEVLGRGVAVPGDAEVLEGEGLVVHPGLVDAHGGAAVEFPEMGGDDDEVLAWDPPRWAQGFMPHRRAADHLGVVGADLADERRKGVVASAVHPDGGLAPGQSAALIHRPHADTPWGLVSEESLGLSMTFRGARGVYPATLFGVIAYVRQAFIDAERWEGLREEYDDDPAGMTAPSFDPDFETLRLAAEGRLPVYFVADEAEEIRRVLRLADELEFRPVIVGGGEAGALAPELASRGVPVLLSVDWSQPRAWDPDDTTGAALEPAAARERLALERRYRAAADLAAAGVAFAFTSGGGRGDMLAGARKAVEYGLAPDRARAALTTTPADFLGLSNLLRIAPGQAATFIVADGDPLEDGTRIAYTFVEGRLERGRAGGGAGGGEPPIADLTGAWEMTVNAQGMEIGMEMTLTQEEGALSGSLASAEMGDSRISGGSISGNAVSLEVSSPQLPEPLMFSGIVSADGSRISGSASTPFGDLSFVAIRKPGGQGGVR